MAMGQPPPLLRVAPKGTLGASGTSGIGGTVLWRWVGVAKMDGKVTESQGFESLEEPPYIEHIHVFMEQFCTLKLDVLRSEMRRNA